MSKNITREYETALVKEFFDWLGRNTYGEVHIGMLDYAYVDRFMSERNVQKVACPHCGGKTHVDIDKTFYSGDREKTGIAECSYCGKLFGARQYDVERWEGAFVESYMCEENGIPHVWEEKGSSKKYKFCEHCGAAEKVDVEVKE